MLEGLVGVKNCVVQSDIFPCHTKALPHWPSVPKRAGRPSIFASERPCFLPRGDSRRMYLAARGRSYHGALLHPPENERLLSSVRYLTL